MANPESEIDYESIDLILTLGDDEFQVNKNVLSKTSNYFRAMFESGMAESSLDSLNIDSPFPTHFNQLYIQFCYQFKDDEMTTYDRELKLWQERITEPTKEFYGQMKNWQWTIGLPMMEYYERMSQDNPIKIVEYNEYNTFFQMCQYFEMEIAKALMYEKVFYLFQLLEKQMDSEPELDLASDEILPYIPSFYSYLESADQLNLITKTLPKLKIQNPGIYLQVYRNMKEYYELNTDHGDFDSFYRFYQNWKKPFFTLKKYGYRTVFSLDQANYPLKQASSPVFEIENYEFPSPENNLVNQETFQKRLNEWTDNLLEFGWKNVCLAGGSLFYLIDSNSHSLSRETDLDLFVFGRSSTVRKEKVEELIHHFYKKYKGDVYFSVRRSVIDIFIRGIERSVQIICTDCETPYQVVNQFDNTALMVYYDGNKTYLLPEAVEAFRTRTTEFITTRVKSLRLYKIIKKGFQIKMKERKQNVGQPFPMHYLEENGITSVDPIEKINYQQLELENPPKIYYPEKGEKKVKEKIQTHMGSHLVTKEAYECLEAVEYDGSFEIYRNSNLIKIQTFNVKELTFDPEKNSSPRKDDKYAKLFPIGIKQNGQVRSVKFISPLMEIGFPGNGYMQGITVFQNRNSVEVQKFYHKIMEIQEVRKTWTTEFFPERNRRHSYDRVMETGNILKYKWDSDSKYKNPVDIVEDFDPEEFPYNQQNIFMGLPTKESTKVTRFTMNGKVESNLQEIHEEIKVKLVFGPKHYYNFNDMRGMSWRLVEIIIYPNNYVE